MDQRREERRLVTCLFIDIVGSTELTMRLGPERLKRALGVAFKEIDRIVSGHGGTVEKYVGDAIYALFGAPVAHPDDPERALRAALECRALASHESDFPFSVRMGIETGEAVVDLTAAEFARQQMSVGAVVNIAARLQQRAEPGQVLVGPTCHDATTEAARYEEIGDIDLKGIGQIPVRSLMEVLPSPGRRRLPFVGRAAELELLDFAFRRSRSRSVLALVSGPPGQGKTRLVDEFVASLDPATRMVTARCRPTGEIGGLEPLQQLLGVASADEMDRLRDLFPDADEWSRIRVALAHSAGLATNAALASLAPDERDDELVNAWRRYVSSLARRGPTVIWLEDVHWAEPLIVRLVDRLTLGTDPLLVVATARPEFAEAAGLRPTGDRFFIELAGLEPDACLQLARSAGDADARAVERAEGNPLFLVELARSHTTAEGDLPLTLQGALGARLDELTPDDRTLLACAAIAGESFTLGDAAALADRDAGEAHRTLARLADRHYLQEVGDAYRFHHSLLRDVAYGRLLVAERMKLHARYARERARPGDVEVLAHHWWAALRPPESDWVWEDRSELSAMRRDALSAHIEAARRDTDHFATARAIELLERARAFVASDVDTARLERALGDAYGRDVRGDESWEHYEKAHAAYERAGAVPIQLLIDMLEIRRKWGGFRDPPSEDRVQPLFVEAERLARAADDRAGLARVLMLRSVHDPNTRSSLAMGGAASDAALLREAVRAADESGDPAALRDGLGWLANHLISEGDIAGATAALDRATEVSVDAPRTVRQDQLLGRCQIAYWSGNIEEGRRVAEQAVGLSQPMGPHLRTHASNWVSAFDLSRGDWAAVQDLAAQTSRLVNANAGTQFCAAAAGNLFRGAASHALAGRADEARALLRICEGIRLADETQALYRGIPAALLGAHGIEPPKRQSDHLRVLRLLLAVLVARWDTAHEEIDHFRKLGAKGAPFASALADAAEEETRAANGGGPPPTHAGLRAIGYVGWSELLARRRTLRA